MMEASPRDPSHAVYIEVLRRMTPEARLKKTFELGELARELFLHGLRERFPEASQEEIEAIYLERLEKCYNANY